MTNKLFLLAFYLLSGTPFIEAALNAYLVLKAEDSQAGREDTIEIYGFSHEIQAEAPADTASGLPTGKRQHKPISVTKPIDKATPLLLKALVDGKKFGVCKIEVYKTAGKLSQERLLYSIDLKSDEDSTGVFICNRSEVLEGGRYSEEVSFCYDEIVWEYADGGITVEDDWETPVV